MVKVRTVPARGSIGLFLLLLWAGLATSVYAQDIVLIDFTRAHQAIPQGWELYVNEGDPQVQLVTTIDGQALQMRSDNASFALQKKLDLPLQDTPFLTWQWKVTTLPDGGDFRQRHTDDQAAQLIVAFSNTRFISYIWDSTVPKGTSGEAPAPPFQKILALVMQSGRQALGTWITERRNLVQDYQALFGEAPTTLRGIRIQINSQHTNSQAESYWKSIVLTKKQPQATQEPTAHMTSWAAVVHPSGH